MSRSGYTDVCVDDWTRIRWRGAVKSAIRGRRGQAFLRELLSTLDAMPNKRLIAGLLETPGGEVCALGAVGRRRGTCLSGIEPEDAERVATVFGIAPALVREIVHANDKGSLWEETSEDRHRRMVSWIKGKLCVDRE